MRTIREDRVEMNNNESAIKKAVYQNNDGSFTWMTYTRSGGCKRLKTALKKAGF